MSRWLLMIQAMLLVYTPGVAMAGGFEFDTQNCPVNRSYPDVLIPPLVAEGLCNFVAAIDNRDIMEAYEMSSPAFQMQTSTADFAATVRETQAPRQTPDPPMRFISQVELRGRDLFEFQLQVFDGSRSYLETIVLNSDGQIEGLRVGPY